MNCPLCQTPLAEIAGHAIHPGDPAYGLTLYCPAARNVCPAQEVMGHGDNAKGAYQVIQDKFNKKKE